MPIPIYAHNFCDAGQLSIFRYFEAWQSLKPEMHYSIWEINFLELLLLLDCILSVLHKKLNIQ